MVPTAVEPDDVLDGRRLRREQNRQAVLDALVELYAEGQYQPGSTLIAERAGLSPRSLFRYFDDIDDLNRAAIECQLAAARPLLHVDVGSDDDTATKVARLVESRAALFEATAPAARAARVCAPSHAVVATQVHDSRSYLRRQIEHLFAPELRGRRKVLLAAVDARCSFETWELLRREQALSRDKAVVALMVAVDTLLAAPGGQR
jgi:AcrR family transcriptional regulator